jgi:hypothetical protein
MRTKPKGKKQHGRPRHRWKDNIETYLTVTGCKGVDWIRLVEDRKQWWDRVNIVLIFGLIKKWKIS